MIVRLPPFPLLVFFGIDLDSAPAAAESTNDRVKYWSIVQTCMLFAVCGWQIFYLKRFFEVKRVV